MPEARLLLRDLIEHATQPEFVYSHKWRVNDLVIWDNRQTMHRGRPFPAHEARDVRRTTVSGDAFDFQTTDGATAMVAASFTGVSAVQTCTFKITGKLNAMP